MWVCMEAGCFVFLCSTKFKKLPLFLLFSVLVLHGADSGLDRTEKV